MADEIERLAQTLLQPKKDVYGDRAKAAKKLSSYLLDIRAFNALFSICSYPDMYAVEDGLLPIVGKSIGKIISERDLIKDPMKHHKLVPRYFNEFHADALLPALSALSEEQLEEVCAYTLANPACSETLTQYFYRLSTDNAFLYQGTDNPRAAKNAINAIRLFKRFRSEEKDLYTHFKDIVMNIIAGQVAITIFPLFISLAKNYSNFNTPETPFEKYSHFHIILITKLVCSDYSNIQTLLKRLKDWVLENLPEDEVYVKVIEIIISGDFPNAYKALQEIREKQKGEDRENQIQEFYYAWYLATNWMVRERI